MQMEREEWVHHKQSWNPAALDWENGAAFPMLLVEVNIAGASVLIVTEIVVIVAVAACVDVSVKADCLRCSECVPVVAFQLLEQVESTYVVLELDLRLYNCQCLANACCAAGE